MRPSNYLPLLTLLLLTPSAYALEYGCKLHPSELNDIGTRMVKVHRKDKKSFPNTVLVQTNVSRSNTEEGLPVNDGTVEGFFRPLEDNYYPIIPIPVLGVYLSRERNVIYYCAHAEKDMTKTHITAYVMRGFHLDKSDIGTFIGNAFKKPQLKVRPAVATFLNTGGIKKFFLKLFAWLPLGNELFDAIDGLQRLIAQSLGEFTGLGIERIVVTQDYVQIAAGVDLEHPEEKPRMRKTIRFEKKQNADGTEGRKAILEDEGSDYDPEAIKRELMRTDSEL